MRLRLRGSARDTTPDPKPVPEQLVAFFYVLLRDHLSAGKVWDILAEHNTAPFGPGNVDYSTPELAHLARRYAQEVVDRG